MKIFDNLDNEKKGFLYGLIGIIIFSVTPPATKIALGFPIPQMSAEFITFGRSSVAGFISLFYLIYFKKKFPNPKQLLTLSIISISLTICFPLFLALGLLHSTSVHSAVILGFLPLATAIIASFYFKHKASAGFWICAVLGGLMVIIYSLLHSKNFYNAFKISYSDIFLFMSVMSASIGYNVGAKLSRDNESITVISSALVIILPFHLLLAIHYFPKYSIHLVSWLAFFYVATFSQWVGLFMWFRGLHLGGPVKVSQIQLLMTFFTFGFSILMLGESLDWLTIIFSLVIIVIIYISKKMDVAKDN